MKSQQLIQTADKDSVGGQLGKRQIAAIEDLPRRERGRLSTIFGSRTFMEIPITIINLDSVAQVAYVGVVLSVPYNIQKCNGRFIDWNRIHRRDLIILIERG